MSNVILASKKVTTQISALKNQKTSDSLGNFNIDDEKNGRRIGMGTLYLISCHL